MFLRDRFESLPYTVFLPDGCSAGTPLPTVLFLHGAGTRGGGLDALEKNGVFAATARFADRQFAVVAPYCEENRVWYDYMETLPRLAEALSEKAFCDSSRLYLMGNSMGGYGTWQLAMSRPQLFAAIVPMCGGGMYWNAGRLKEVPVWAFHGAEDAAVLVEESVKMVNAVNAKGGCAKLTVYPETYHDCWTPTYQNPAVFDWLLEHRKERV